MRMVWGSQGPSKICYKWKPWWIYLWLWMHVLSYVKVSLIVFMIFWHPKVVSSKKRLVAQRTPWLCTSPDVVCTCLGERASGYRNILNWIKRSLLWVSLFIHCIYTVVLRCVFVLVSSNLSLSPENWDRWRTETATPSTAKYPLPFFNT